MGQIITSGSILLYILGLTITNSLSVPDSQFFMTEEVRVKRQAGYVYSRPSVPFDLPERAPAPPPTQAPNVDRTQAQMMYYAYPAPAPVSAPAPVAAPAPSGAPAVANNPAATDGSSAGYNYGAQAQGGGVAQTGAFQSGGAAQVGGAQTSGAAGYSYNTPASNSDSNAGGSQTSGSSQTNAGAQASTSSDSSGYTYKVPKARPASQSSPGSEGVSTNAPKYLPPVADVDVRGVDGGSGPAPADAAGSKGSTSSGSSGYGGGAPPASVPPVTDQYLPPLTQSNTENTLPSPNVNAATNTVGEANDGNTGGGPSIAYIPPGPQRPPPSDVTPRPFAPPVPGGYLPPVDTNTLPNQGSVSTPASTYLPPIL